MSRYQTFSRGGIRPPDAKYSTSKIGIKTCPLPDVAIVPFLQHIGTQARPTVKLNDRVNEGQLIGEPSSLISAAIHSPVAGIVSEFRSIFLPMGIKTDAAVIKRDRNIHSPIKHEENHDWQSLEIEELLEILKWKGVVGQGGATFPSHIKFSIPKGHDCEVFLINACECEPYLSADHRLILESTEQIMEGIKIVQKLLNPKRVVIGIEANKQDAIEMLTAAGTAREVEVVHLKAKYPQGAEKNLIEAILGYEVPSGKLPLEVGVINSNVGTLFSVYEALVRNKPVVERVLTVAGGAIAHPANVRARVGSPVSSLIEECDGFREEPVKLVMGGPMMGFAFNNLDTPVIKGTSGILALTGNEVNTSATTPCISCGRCVGVCPMGLSPTTIFKKIEHERFDEATKYGLEDCVLCGACSYVCPAHIPLVSAFRAGRGRKRRLAARRKK